MKQMLMLPYSGEEEEPVLPTPVTLPSQAGA